MDNEIDEIAQPIYSEQTSNASENQSSGHKESEEINDASENQLSGHKESEEINYVSENQSSGYRENDMDDEIVNVNEVALKTSNLFKD